MASAAVKESASGALTLGGLLPGALVTAKVRAVVKDGLLVTFLTYFNGESDWVNLVRCGLVCWVVCWACLLVGLGSQPGLHCKERPS